MFIKNFFFVFGKHSVQLAIQTIPIVTILTVQNNGIVYAAIHIITNTSQKYHFQHVNSERKQQITTSPGQIHHNKIIFKI